MTRCTQRTTVIRIESSLPRFAHWHDVVDVFGRRHPVLLQAHLAQVVIPGQHNGAYSLPRCGVVEPFEFRVSLGLVVLPMSVPVALALVLRSLLVRPRVSRAIARRWPHEFVAPDLPAGS